MPPDNNRDKRIRQLRTQGLRWAEIAGELGINESTLHNHAMRLGLTKSRGGHEARNAEIVRRAKAGELHRTIAADLGLTHQQVSAVARAGGVHRKKGRKQRVVSGKKAEQRKELAARDALIHQAVLAGEEYEVIAERFGLSRQSVSRIALRIRRRRRRRS